MKFGVNTFLFTSPFTDESTDILKLIREIGFDGVEISLENIGDFDCGETLKALKDNGLACCSVCGFFAKDRDLRGSQSQQNTSKQQLPKNNGINRSMQFELL